MEDQSRVDRTPYNIRADYNEADRNFRDRLNTLLPSNLAQRVNEVLSKRFKEEVKEENSAS